MKQVIVFLTIILTSFTALAQSKKDILTETYKVDGNCDMCKKRIEEAAYINGVKRAKWNAETHELTVVYKPSKTNANDILANVAKSGYSSEKIAATETDYNKLPECCHYKTASCNH